LELALPEVVLDIWSRYQQEIWVLGIASAAMLVISAMLIPFLIVRLPADFYAENSHRRRLFQDRPLLRIAFLAVKNALGTVLMVAGILMLVLPGQGILTILAALALLDFPGKRALEMRILQRPAILKSINWLRQRAGRRPLSF
jgi:hypothetical protein